MELFSFIFGAVMGSFFNVVILRMPKGESVISPRSHCPSCKRVIPFYYNIPLFSFLFLRAKCAFCKEKIPCTYFVVELLSAFIALFLFMKFSLSLEFFVIYGFFSLLIILSFIDFEYKAVPDYLLLFIFFISFFITSFPLIEAFKNAFIFSGAFVLLNFVLTFYVQNIKARLLKDDSLKDQVALGEGDIPIIASIAIILGIKAALIAIFLAALFAIIPSIYSHFVKKDIQTPFIPYLSLGFTFEYVFTLEQYLRFII